MIRAVLVSLALLAAACTPAQVQFFNDHTGEKVTTEEATEWWCAAKGTENRRVLVRQVLDIPRPYWPEKSGGCIKEPPPPPPPPPVPLNQQWPWYQLAQCESGGNWFINTGNGYYGGLQFSLQSWHGVGGTGYPHQHSPDEQIYRAQRLQAIQGWNAWPACSRKIGLL